MRQGTTTRDNSKTRTETPSASGAIRVRKTGAMDFGLDMIGKKWTHNSDSQCRLL